MDRLNLDQTGARRGELYRHSLQMGDDTVTLENIATMAIENDQFMPYKTEPNRRSVGLWTGLALVTFLTGSVAFAIVAGGGGLVSVAGLIGVLSLLACLAGAWFAIRLMMAMNKVENFYRLRIGASDGRQLTLVDDNRGVLERIRDTIRAKIDADDYETEGVFDLDADSLTLNSDEPEPELEPSGEESVSEPSANDTSASEDGESAQEEEDTDNKGAPVFEPEDEIVLGEDDDEQLEEKLTALLKGETA